MVYCRHKILILLLLNQKRQVAHDKLDRVTDSKAIAGQLVFQFFNKSFKSKMELYNEIFGDLNTDNKAFNTTKMNALSLLKEDNENGGVLIGETLVSDLKSVRAIRPSFVLHTKKLIDGMNAKLKFAVEPNEGVESGMKVIWCRFKDGNLNSPLCVPNINGLAELIYLYRHDKIVVNVDFEGLLKQINQPKD